MPDPFVTPGFIPSGFNPGEEIYRAGVAYRLTVKPAVSFRLAVSPSISCRLVVGP